MKLGLMIAHFAPITLLAFEIVSLPFSSLLGAGDEDIALLLDRKSLLKVDSPLFRLLVSGLYCCITIKRSQARLEGFDISSLYGKEETNRLVLLEMNGVIRTRDFPAHGKTTLLIPVAFYDSCERLNTVLELIGQAANPNIDARRSLKEARNVKCDDSGAKSRNDGRIAVRRRGREVKREITLGLSSAPGDGKSLFEQDFPTVLIGMEKR